MAQANLKLIQGNMRKKLEAMIQSGRSPRAFLERIVYPTYLRAQMKRWMSEGRSDGSGPMLSWAPLSAKYKKTKLIRFASAPGAGRKTLIASGTLYKAILNEGPGHRKMIGDKSIIVGVDVAYAKYVNQKRPFFIFSDQMMDGLKARYKKFITNRGGSEWQSLG